VGTTEKKLCFGVFAKILKLCGTSSLTDVKTVDILTKAIDPDSLYAEGGHGSSVSRLLNCTGDFSLGSVNAGNEYNEYGTARANALSNIKQLAPSASKTEVSKFLEDNLLGLMDDDKKAQAVLALLNVIREDTAIATERSESFKKYFSVSREKMLKANEVVLSDFLANILLYSVMVVENRVGRMCVKEIDKNYINGFKNERAPQIWDSIAQKDAKLIEQAGLCNDHMEENPNENLVYNQTPSMQMLEVFKKAILDYHIVEFIKHDPTNYLPQDLVFDVDSFAEEIERNVINAFVHNQKDRVYRMIHEFSRTLDEYAKYIGVNSQPIFKGIDVFVPKYRDEDTRFAREYAHEVEKYRLKINTLYGEICDGDTLFV